MSMSSPAIQVRIGRRVGAAHLAVIAAVFIVGLLTGLHVADGGGLRPVAPATSAVYPTLQDHGPQGHIADLHHPAIPAPR